MIYLGQGKNSWGILLEHIKSKVSIYRLNSWVIQYNSLRNYFLSPWGLNFKDVNDTNGSQANMYKHRTSHSRRRGQLRHSIAKNTSYSAVLPFNLNQYSQHELRGGSSHKTKRTVLLHSSCSHIECERAHTHTHKSSESSHTSCREERGKSKNNEQVQEIQEKGDSLCGIIWQ